ncbi:tetratricopeptide repeat protein [Massilia sp. Dwa41.01b]|uniref:tetratricopeptide repeat protein n=1 Tax=unclassified Massilia TaxID=2609279 RepID=UPI001601C271|nr:MULTISPECIES: tetratricopeptide repeat protein [unclassified Massilia]QNA88754.1 tetratricopeptide repeat protein [Massilia sp. Dwa41.01b]QNA99657.1 tetratricopeptide repeat protein [Massilia sp. Se16.2.3]
MMFKRLMPVLACAALLAACESPGGGTASAAAGTTMASAMKAADAAVAAGQHDKAYAALKSASQTFPTEKTPWVRMAQMRFDSAHYGEAIVNAQEALARDPDDTVAHSIAAVSGLRVTSKALADLTRKNKLNGNVKSEAEELAKLLRTSLGETDLVPGKKNLAPRPRPVPTTASAASPSKPPATSSDPFGALK